jgi:hypothetical protein
MSEHVTSDLVVAVVQIPALASADLGSVSVQLGFFAVIFVLVGCLLCAAHTRYQCTHTAYSVSPRLMFSIFLRVLSSLACN